MKKDKGRYYPWNCNLYLNDCDQVFSYILKNVTNIRRTQQRAKLNEKKTFLIFAVKKRIFSQDQYFYTTSYFGNFNI